MEAHGRTSCSEWTGVLLSLLLREAGMQNGAQWLIGKGAEGGWTLRLCRRSKCQSVPATTRALKTTCPEEEVRRSRGYNSPGTS